MTNWLAFDSLTQDELGIFASEAEALACAEAHAAHPDVLPDDRPACGRFDGRSEPAIQAVAPGLRAVAVAIAIAVKGVHAERERMERWRAVADGAVILAARAVADRAWGAVRLWEDVAKNARNWSGYSADIMGIDRPAPTGQALVAEKVGIGASADVVRGAIKIVAANREAKRKHEVGTPRPPRGRR